MQINFTQLQDFVPSNTDDLQDIGNGTFSTVKLCSHKDYPEKQYALKIQKVENETDLFFVKQEIELHKQLKHQNIVQILGHVQQNNKFYIFLEYANNNDLFEYIYNKELTENQKYTIFKQICLGVQACHEKNILHRDLKPENILLTENFQVKLCDFGWSCRESQISQLQSNCGTQDYNSPEVLRAQVQCKAVDIWALGIILYELYHHNLPFSVKENFKYEKAVKKIKFKKNINKNLKKLILKMLNVKVSERPTIQQVLQHKFMKKDIECSIFKDKCNSKEFILNEIKLNASQKKNFNLFSIKKQENKNNQILSKNILFQKGKTFLQKTCTLSTQASSELVHPQIQQNNQDLQKQKTIQTKKSNFVRKFSLLENFQQVSLICTGKKKLRKSLTKIVLQNSKFDKLQKQNTLF